MDKLRLAVDWTICAAGVAAFAVAGTLVSWGLLVAFFPGFGR
jgi:hypothetical protein